jgi:RNA polymerase sigma factor (sigma-70 family)
MSEDFSKTNMLSVWWSQTLDGDTNAFSNIHKELFDGLYYYALKLLGDSATANDIIQELFIKLWIKRNSIGQLKNVKSYFFISLRRQVLNHLRGIKTRSILLTAADELDIEFSPEEIVIKNYESNLLHENLMKLLNELPRRQKEVIYLHYFEEMDYGQIASVMGINYQSVLNLVQHAMKKLRAKNLLVFLFSAISFCNFHQQ